MEMLTGNGYPSKHLKGEVGQHYKDLETGDIFECVSANKHSRINLHQTGGYIWKKVARGEHMEVCAGGGGGSGGSVPILTITADEDGENLTASMSFDEVVNMLNNGIPFITSVAYCGNYVALQTIVEGSYNNPNERIVFTLTGDWALTYYSTGEISGS